MITKSLSIHLELTRVVVVSFKRKILNVDVLVLKTFAQCVHLSNYHIEPVVIANTMFFFLQKLKYWIEAKSMIQL